MPVTRRLTSLLIASGMCVGVLAGHTPAQGAAETCQGRSATIVGSPGKIRLTGTEGADVIVSHGSASILSLGGDDVICLTSSTRGRDSVRVYAGDGDDVVINLRNGRKSKALTALGLGNDVYVGSNGRDIIRETYDQPADDGIDDIRTRSGEDRVETGVSGHPNSDIANLGAGRDELTVNASDGTDATLEGGRGVDTLRGSGLQDGAWVLDNRTQTASVDGVLKFGWYAFEGFTLGGFGRTSQRFVGGWADETVTASNFYPIVADMGGGNDLLVASVFDTLSNVPADWRFTGGGGRDGFALTTTSSDRFRADVDARRQRLGIDGPAERNDVSVSLPGFEDFSAEAGIVRITGSRQGERLSANGCDVRIDGGGGDDRLSGERDRFYASCKGSRPSRLVGGSGDDRLTGSNFKDALVGGPGRDVADGRGGRDTCHAEVERSCERG